MEEKRCGQRRETQHPGALEKKEGPGAGESPPFTCSKYATIRGEKACRSSRTARLSFSADLKSLDALARSGFGVNIAAVYLAHPRSKNASALGDALIIDVSNATERSNSPRANAR